MSASRVCLGLTLLLAAAPQMGLACDSTSCLLVTRSANGMLPAKTWRLDLSFRTTDDGVLLGGSQRIDRVNRPKVDFEHGLVRPGFHQDLGGTFHALQAEVAYGLGRRTTALVSAPIVTRRAYDIGHVGALTEKYETWGLGDTLVGVRRAVAASASFSCAAGVGLELPTGKHRLVNAAALYDIGVLDPLLQPGSGSFDLVLNAQGSRRLAAGALDLSAAVSYQRNTTNGLDYRYGDDAIASLSLGGALGGRVRGSLQAKWTHRGRSAYRDEPVPSTGGTLVYAIPGLSVSLPARLSVYVFVPVPVYRYVNETQLAPRLTLVVGTTRTF